MIDTVFESDRKQSVDVANILQINRERAERRLVDPTGVTGPVDELPVPKAGIYCAKDKKHGRMLMSKKTGMLECGVCEWSIAPPKD